METPSRNQPSEDADSIMEDDATATAYEAIQAQLDRWTSPRVNKSSWTDVSAMRDDNDDDDGMVLTSSRNNNKRSSSTRKTPSSSATKVSPPGVYKYERNVMDWWNRELVDPAPRDNVDDEIVPLSTGTLRVTRTPNKQTAAASSATVERAATPVMSNSSRRKQLGRNYGGSGIRSSKSASQPSLLRDLEESEETDDDAAIAEDGEMIMPVPVQSPWPMRPGQSPYNARGGIFGGASSNATNTPRAISPFRNAPYEYRRYHDALKSFLNARRSLSDRIDMDREEAALALTAAQAGANNTNEDNDDPIAMPDTVGVFLLGPVGDPKLAHEEALVELEFLRTLKSLCWERDPPAQTNQDLGSRREGNFWALMCELRQAGLASLLWADDGASMRQNELSQSAYMEHQAAHIHATPKELVEHLAGSSNETPLVLKRRQHMLTWLEHCMNQLITAETKASVSMASDDKKAIFSNTTDLEAKSRHMEKVMQSCLSLMLAGRLKDARLLLRKAGQPWMAAKLGGGAPAGIEKIADDAIETVEQVKVGNVNRPLWKRQTWKLSKKMSSDESEVSPEEAAVHQILANDYRNAMENIALRSWEKGLYVLLHALRGRSEDELLHLHNNHRRKARPPFPGTLYEKEEREQLQATCQLSTMTEIGVVEMLSASPFDAMKGQENPCNAIAALLVGRHSLTDFLRQETQSLINDNNTMNEPLDENISRLRFVTHLLLYLDSLYACTTPVALDGILELKNQALFAYVDHLAGHEDLWHFLVLYASLMPEDVIIDYFPAVLARVEGGDERRMMTSQARDLFVSKGLDLEVLRRVVRLMLAEEDDMETTEDDENDTSTPTRSDVRKMKAMEWLCFYREHTGDALVAANMLLRQFLLANKFAGAIMFLEDFLPANVLEDVMASFVATSDEDNEDAIAENELYQAKIGEARAEHVAFQSYLKAFTAVDEFSLVLLSTPYAGLSVDDKVDPTALNESEQAIAKSMERRDLIRQKRKISQLLVEAAETARNDIMSVLLHDGGWLVDGGEGDIGVADNSDDERRQRKVEIQALRSRLLPHAVKLFHQVCEDTAGWMWSSLLDASPELGPSPKEVLEALDDDTRTGALSPLSPRYWTQKALDLAETVSSDEFLVLQAFDAAELKDMLARMSNIALSDLMYSA